MQKMVGREGLLDLHDAGQEMKPHYPPVSEARETRHMPCPRSGSPNCSGEILWWEDWVALRSAVKVATPVVEEFH